MENLNFQQKIAVMRILLDIVNADGRIDERETFYYNKIASALGLKEQDLSTVIDANSLLCLLEIKGFNKEQKIQMAKMMGQQIVVDMDINVNEMAIFNLVCDTCNIDIDFSEVVTAEQLENSTRS